MLLASAHRLDRATASQQASRVATTSTANRNPKPGLDQTVAVVTGAGRGLGRSLAVAMADAGAKVAILARSDDELGAVAKEIRARGGVALVIRADLGDARHVERAASQILAELGTVQVLINNAAVVWPLTRAATLVSSEWAAAFAINVLAPVGLTLALLPRMLESGWGRIVNVSSAIVTRPAALGFNAYAASKVALEAHTLNLAADLVGSGVTVNGFRPGSMDTEMNAWVCRQPKDVIGEVAHARFNKLKADGLLVAPERVAQSVLALLAKEDTGRIWEVDAR